MRRRLLPLLAVLILLGIWELYVLIDGVSSLVLPSPIDVARALWDDRGTLWHNLKPTALEVVLGILLGTVVALALTAAMHFSALIREALYPLLVASQTVPLPIVASLLIIWLGFGLVPKLLIVALVAFFPIVVTALSALATVDPDLIKLMRTLDAGRWQTFRLIELPAALPGVFAGARIGAVFSVLAAIFAEINGSTSGLGYLLNVTVANLEMSEAFASVLVLAAFAILLFALLTLAERRALPWAHRLESSNTR
jgi:NitT/TauT family transport system permease protein/putative hydroxymethylpyrimidine transport system permease protein